MKSANSNENEFETIRIIPFSKAVNLPGRVLPRLKLSSFLPKKRPHSGQRVSSGKPVRLYPHFWHRRPESNVGEVSA